MFQIERQNQDWQPVSPLVYSMIGVFVQTASRLQHLSSGPANLLIFLVNKPEGVRLFRVYESTFSRGSGGECFVRVRRLLCGGFSSEKPRFSQFLLTGETEWWPCEFLFPSKRSTTRENRIAFSREILEISYSINLTSSNSFTHSFH